MDNFIMLVLIVFPAIFLLVAPWYARSGRRQNDTVYMGTAVIAGAAVALPIVGLIFEVLQYLFEPVVFSSRVGDAIRSTWPIIAAALVYNLYFHCIARWKKVSQNAKQR